MADNKSYVDYTRLHTQTIPMPGHGIGGQPRDVLVGANGARRIAKALP